MNVIKLIDEKNLHLTWQFYWDPKLYHLEYNQQQPNNVNKFKQKQCEHGFMV